MKRTNQVNGIKLPHGEGKRIAQKVCKTPAYVSQVLKGQHFDAEILEEAAKVLNNNMHQLNKVKARIDAAMR